MERKQCDVAVIGSGPGGYIAAIRARQLNKSVVLIEKGAMGGTCLNVGCIPTKTLLASAGVLHQVKRAAEFGIETGPVSFAYAQMKARKDAVVAKMRGGLEGLLKANQLTVCRGTAQFESPHELKIEGEESLFLKAETIIIATGSIPVDVKAFPCDHKRILNSTSILELTEMPKSLCIVGGGYIGCEFASLFAELGTKVTILEALPTILTAQGEKVSQFMTQTFGKKGIQIETNVKVESIINQGKEVEVRLVGGKTSRFEYALVAVGRKVYTEGLRLEKAGLRLNERGALSVNERMETEVRGIYAIGDVTGQWMLAHVASHQGIVAAENGAGQTSVVHYDSVPAVVFTSPEIATVGLSEEQAKAKGIQVVSSSIPFQAMGKAQAALETDGFAQVIADKKTGQILGAVAVGHEASNLIAEMGLAIQNELTLDSVWETIHAHPTLAEIWHEAAALAMDSPLNFPPKVKR